MHELLRKSQTQQILFCITYKKNAIYFLPRMLYYIVVDIPEVHEFWMF